MANKMILFSLQSLHHLKTSNRYPPQVDSMRDVMRRDQDPYVGKKEEMQT